MTTQPTRAMWWSEVVVLLAVTGATLVAIAFLVSLANRGGDVTFDGVLSILSTALSIGVGRIVSVRFRAWGLRRQAVSCTRS
ncbi:hypothetical protein ACIQ9K_33825 [Streptomyces microflavus]|uniref:hypothetical protein n=1 Tax=Streptomyces microflavus TaxID=1919 RepID=UPI0037F868D3